MNVLKKIFALTALGVNVVGYPVKVLALRNSRRVRVLVLLDDSVLLLKSSIGSQRWSMPGGGITKGEDAKKAAVRETYEETGILLGSEVLKKLGTVRRSIFLTPFTYEITFFVVALSGVHSARIIRPAEVLEVRWFKKNKLPEYRSQTIETAFNLYNKR